MFDTDENIDFDAIIQNLNPVEKKRFYWNVVSLIFLSKRMLMRKQFKRRCLMIFYQNSTNL